MFARDAINLLVSDLKTTLTGLVSASNIAPGWPTLDTLANLVVKSGQAVVSIYDRGNSRDASRFMLYAANEIVATAGTTTTLSRPTLAALGAATITIGGTPVVNDAVSLVATSSLTVSAAVTAGAAAGVTTADIAAALATAINAASPMNTWLTASAAGAVVTLTSTVDGILSLSSTAGNIGTRYTEVDRKVRDIQIDLWAPSDALRTQAARLIDARLSYLDAHFGLQGTGPPADDGTWVRLRNLHDRFTDGDVLKDVYRWYWIEGMEYGQTAQESLYSVLAFEPTFTVQTPSGTVTLP